MNPLTTEITIPSVKFRDDYASGLRLRSVRFTAFGHFWSPCGRPWLGVIARMTGEDVA